MSRPGFCPWLAAGAPTDWWGRLRDLTGPVPTYKLAGDITYLRTGQGWLFLATVVDLTARMVAGWACVRAHSRRHSRLSPRAGPQARPQGRRAISHSDRNSQHTSRMLASWAREDDVGPSCGVTGSCHGNAPAESFFATLRSEMYCRRPSATREEAIFAVIGFIESCYNRRHPHPTIGYRVPADVMEESFERFESALSEPREVLRAA